MSFPFSYIFLCDCYILLNLFSTWICMKYWTLDTMNTPPPTPRNQHLSNHFVFGGSDNVYLFCFVFRSSHNNYLFLLVFRSSGEVYLFCFVLEALIMFICPFLYWDQLIRVMCSLLYQDPFIMFYHGLRIVLSFTEHVFMCSVWYLEQLIMLCLSFRSTCVLPRVLLSLCCLKFSCLYNVV